MYRFGLCIVLAVFVYQTALADTSDKRKEKADVSFVSLPINSKFWNPQLDDKTNMELIGVEYLDDLNKTVLEVLAKSLTRSSAPAKNLTSDPSEKPKRGDKYFVWGLLNLLKPVTWTNARQEGSLRSGSKSRRVFN